MKIQVKIEVKIFYLQHVELVALPVFILIAKCNGGVVQGLVIIQPCLGRNWGMDQFVGGHRNLTKWKELFFQTRMSIIYLFKSSD